MAVGDVHRSPTDIRGSKADLREQNLKFQCSAVPLAPPENPCYTARLPARTLVIRWTAEPARGCGGTGRRTGFRSRNNHWLYWI